MNHIMFNTDDWNLDHRVTSNVGYVTEAKGYNGETASVWRLADWNWSWTSLMHTFKPEKNTDYSFTFWLNGGENNRYDEVCSLEVWFDENWEARTEYKLNRQFTKAEKIVNGWNLYEIKFNSANADKINLRFNCMGAPTFIAPAEKKEAYADIVSEVPDVSRPQRANCFFANGYPEEENQNRNNNSGANINIDISRIIIYASLICGFISFIVLVKKLISKKKAK